MSIVKRAMAIMVVVEVVMVGIMAIMVIAIVLVGVLVYGRLRCIHTEEDIINLTMRLLP
jgi:hypothetical protein